MRSQASQTVITFAAAGLFAAMALPAHAQVFDPGPSDPGLFDSVVDIPADVNPLETTHIAPDTAGGTKQINLADGGAIVVLDTLATVESGVELNVTGGEISDTLQFSGANFDFKAGSEANISGGTSQAIWLRGDVGSLINVTGGDYLVSPGAGRISTGGNLNMSGGRFNSVSAGVANISGDANIARFRVGSGNTANFMGGLAGDLTMGSNSTLNLTGGTVGIAGEPTIAGFNVTLDIDGGLFQTILTLDGGSRVYVRGGAVHSLHAGRSVPDQDPLGSQDVKIDVSGGTIGRIEVRSPWVFAGSLPNVATVTGGRVGTIAAENGAQVRLSGGAVYGFDLEVGADVVLSGGELMLNGAPYTEPSVELIEGDLFTGTLLDGSPFVYQFGDLDEHITLDTQPVPPADLTPIVVDAPSDLYGLRAGQSLTLRDGGTLRDNFSMVNADLTIEGGAFGVSPLNGRPAKVAGSNILMTGGEITVYTRLVDGSTFTMGGGHIDDPLSISRGSVANIYGGSWDGIHDIQGEANLFGSGFALDGVPIEGLVPGEPHEIEEDGFLTGQLADGTSFSLNHGSFITPGPITVTLFTNNPPVAQDDSFTTPEETGLTGNVLEDNGNGADSDADGAPFPLRVSLVTAPGNGDLTLNPDGSFSYTPNMDFFGTDSFDYEVADGIGGTDQATVTITVTAVNDVPVAQDDSFTTPEDTGLTGNVLADNGNGADSDADGDPLSVSLVTAPVDGDLTLNPDGSFSYTPNMDFFGADGFDYEVADGNGGTDQATVTITVTAVNDAPVARDDSFTTPEDTELTGNVLADNGHGADNDADGDPLSVSLVTAPGNGDLTLNPDGSFSYTPNMDFFGADSFDYEVADGNGGTDQATVTITVTPRPELSLMPGIWDFGDVQAGGTAVSDPFVVENTGGGGGGGGGDLVIGMIAIEGPAVGDFQLEDDICSGQTVAPGGFCGFSVRFTPAAAGIRRAEVHVPGNAPESPAAATLIGTRDVVFFDGLEG